MGIFDYSNFNRESFGTFDSGFESKIENGEALRKDEKVLLGKKLSKIESNSIGGFFKYLISRFTKQSREQYLIDRADKYIQLKTKFKYEHLREIDKDVRARNYTFEDTEYTPDEDYKHFEKLMEEIMLPRKPPESAKSDIITTETPLEEKIHPPNNEVREVFRTRVNYSLIEQRKAQEGERILMNLSNVFGLGVLPDVPNEEILIAGRVVKPEDLRLLYKECNRQKIALMKKHISLVPSLLVPSQASKYPIMRAAVAKIQENLEKWEDLEFSNDKDGLESLKQTLEQQFKNLSELSDILAALTSKEEESQIFMVMYPGYTAEIDFGDGETVRQGFQDSLNLYLDGKGDLREAGRGEELGKMLKYFANQLKTELPKEPFSADLRQRRKSAPVTTKAIQLQAELHQAIRKGKRWALSQPSLTPMGTSANEVFKLKDAKTGEAAAFFKVGTGGEPAAGIMEKLMWDVSVILGFEENFVPTGQTTVQASSDVTVSKERPMGELGARGRREDWSAKKLEEEKTAKTALWRAEGELHEAVGAFKGRRGGIQFAQKGANMWDYRDKPGERSVTVPKSELMRGMLANIAFGMFDCHGGNMFIAEDGKIKFFDNTRSLPNSNGFINRGGYLVSAFRSTLLDLPETREPLTPEEVNDLKRQVAELKEKIGTLKEFLNSPKTEAQLKKLPPGWLDKKKAIAAMEERLELFEGALNAEGAKTLQEVVLQSLPNYKFAFALGYLNRLAEGKCAPTESAEHVQKWMHTQVGYSRFNDDLDEAANLGYDVELVKALSENPDLSMNELISAVQQHFNDRGFFPLPEALVLARSAKAKEIKAEIEKGAAMDFKDWERASCRSKTRNENLKLFAAEGLKPSVDDNLSIAILLANRNHEDIKLLDQGGSYVILYNTPTGYRVKNVDLKATLGCVVCDGKEIPIKEFVDSLKEQKGPPLFEELPLIAQEFSVVVVKERYTPGKVMLRKSQDNRSLVVGCMLGMKAVEYKFPPGSDGKFIVNRREMTIQEIIDMYSEAKTKP